MTQDVCGLSVEMCLSEQIHDNIKFEVSVKYKVDGTSLVKTIISFRFSHQIAAKKSDEKHKPKDKRYLSQLA